MSSLPARSNASAKIRNHLPLPHPGYAVKGHRSIWYGNRQARHSKDLQLWAVSSMTLRTSSHDSPACHRLLILRQIYNPQWNFSRRSTEGKYIVGFWLGEYR